MSPLDVNDFQQVGNGQDYQAHLYDSRYAYPYNSPVNVNYKKATVVSTITPSPNMYSPLFKSNQPLNELTYSGGNTQLLRIPLQMNEPNSNEMLRSQDILITPYNRVKYSEQC